MNVQQSGLQGGVPNVRPAANVSGSVKILIYLLVCNVVCERLIDQVSVPQPRSGNGNQTNVSVICNVFANFD